MNIYVFQSAFLCEGCAKAVQMDWRIAHGMQTDQTEDNALYPQGPYAEGGANLTARNIATIAACFWRIR